MAPAPTATVSALSALLSRTVTFVSVVVIEFALTRNDSWDTVIPTLGNISKFASVASSYIPPAIGRYVVVLNETD